jgi:hypothetical protein
MLRRRRFAIRVLVLDHLLDIWSPSTVKETPFLFSTL